MRVFLYVPLPGLNTWPTHAPRGNNNCQCLIPNQGSIKAPSPTYWGAIYASAPSVVAPDGTWAGANCINKVAIIPQLVGDGIHPENSDKYQQMKLANRHPMYANPRIETGVSLNAALTPRLEIRIGIPGYLISQYNIPRATLARRVITKRGRLSLVILEFAPSRAPVIYLVFPAWGFTTSFWVTATNFYSIKFPRYRSLRLVKMRNLPLIRSPHRETAANSAWSIIDAYGSCLSRTGSCPPYGKTPILATSIAESHNRPSARPSNTINPSGRRVLRGRVALQYDAYKWAETKTSTVSSTKSSVAFSFPPALLVQRRAARWNHVHKSRQNKLGFGSAPGGAAKGRCIRFVFPTSQSLGAMGGRFIFCPRFIDRELPQLGIR